MKIWRDAWIAGTILKNVEVNTQEMCMDLCLNSAECVAFESDKDESGRDITISCMLLKNINRVGITDEMMKLGYYHELVGIKCGYEATTADAKLNTSADEIYPSAGKC